MAAGSGYGMFKKIYKNKILCLKTKQKALQMLSWSKLYKQHGQKNEDKIHSWLVISD